MCHSITIASHPRSTEPDTTLTLRSFGVRMRRDLLSVVNALPIQFERMSIEGESVHHPNLEAVVNTRCLKRVCS